MTNDKHIEEVSMIPLQQRSETPRLVSRVANPVERKPEGNANRPKRSKYLGMLLFLQETQQLTEDQLRFVRQLQGRCKFTELVTAIELCRKLKESGRSAARARVELERIRQDCPRLSAKSVLREERRIGVGYKDKGALKLPHEDHETPPRMWWSADIDSGLLEKPEEPRWITSDELFGMDRYSEMQWLALHALLLNSSSTRQPFWESS